MFFFLAACRRGDQILSVNGHMLEGVDLNEAHACFAQLDPGPVEIVLRRRASDNKIEGERTGAKVSAASMNVSHISLQYLRNTLLSGDSRNVLQPGFVKET